MSLLCHSRLSQLLLCCIVEPPVKLRSTSFLRISSSPNMWRRSYSRFIWNVRRCLNTKRGSTYAKNFGYSGSDACKTSESDWDRGLVVCLVGNPCATSASSHISSFFCSIAALFEFPWTRGTSQQIPEASGRASMVMSGNTQCKMKLCRWYWAVPMLAARKLRNAPMMWSFSSALVSCLSLLWSYLVYLL